MELKCPIEEWLGFHSKIPIRKSITALASFVLSGRREALMAFLADYGAASR
jgi:hypothetical protein